METHAHHFHKAPGKGFKHYVFEFFMLFLAVFCGFLAENVREHRVEHTREKQYMKTLVADLKSDTMQARLWIVMQKEILKGMDSLLTALKTPEVPDHAEAINRCAHYAKQDLQFIPAGRTMNQLKNSGNMRLIRVAAISDSIVLYDQFLQFVSDSYDEMTRTRNFALNAMDELVDQNMDTTGEVINRQMLIASPLNKLLTKDRMKQDILFNKLARLKEHEVKYGQALKFVKYSATNLIKQIEREYHLE